MNLVICGCHQHRCRLRDSLVRVDMLLEAGADRHARAAHREFGKNLELEDVTTDKAILQLLAKYP